MEQQSEQQSELVLAYATEVIVDGVRKLKCSHCGNVWTPRKVTPRQCPNCKRTVSVSGEMVDIKRHKVLAGLPEVKAVREVVPEYFTPQCVLCGGEATTQYKGNFLCGGCLVEEMKRDGLVT